MSKQSSNGSRRKIIVSMVIALVLILIGIFVLVYNMASMRKVTEEPGQFGVLSEEVLIEVNPNDLPPDALYITPQRKNYAPGTMQLIIPKLELDTPVAATTLPHELLEMPGLYELSQMPSLESKNVSIAAHRDLGKQEFYFLDQVEENDYIYLVYENNVYQYQFVSSEIVKPTDWSVLQNKDYSAVTLTTCDPIGTSRNRLIVVGRLVNISPYNADYTFE